MLTCKNAENRNYSTLCDNIRIINDAFQLHTVIQSTICANSNVKQPEIVIIAPFAGPLRRGPGPVFPRGPACRVFRKKNVFT